MNVVYSKTLTSLSILSFRRSGYCMYYSFYRLQRLKNLRKVKIAVSKQFFIPRNKFYCSNF